MRAEITSTPRHRGRRLPGARVTVRGAEPNARGIFDHRYPAAGVVCVALGTGFAWFRTPEVLTGGQYELLWPSLWLALSLLAVPIVSALGNSRNLFRAEHIVVIGPVFWLLLDPIQGAYGMEGVSSAHLRQAYLAIGLFAGCAWVGAMGRGWRAPKLFLRAASHPLPVGALFSVGILAFLLAFLRFAFPVGFSPALLWAGLLGGRWSAGWGRGNLGGADAFMDHIGYFGYVLPALTVAVSRRVGWGNYRTLILAILALIITAFFAQGGGRRIVGTLFGSALIFWILSNPRGQVKNLILTSVLVLGIWATMEFMLSYRDAGLGALVQDPSLKEEASSAKGAGVAMRVDDNFLRLAQMTSIFPEQHAYTTWRYVLFIAVRPVPRLFWPGKPVDAGFDLPEFLGSTGASLSVSVIGELVMAGGMLAVALGGWFYGRLGLSWSNFLQANPTPSAMIMFSIGLLALFGGERSMLDLVLVSYGALAWVVLVWFMGRHTAPCRPIRRATGGSAFIPPI